MCCHLLILQERCCVKYSELHFLQWSDIFSISMFVYDPLTHASTYKGTALLLQCLVCGTVCC